MLQDPIVIVVNNSNYDPSYAETVPFKAVVEDSVGTTVWVKSTVTGKTYELYPEQMLEGLEIEQIKAMLDVSKYNS
jgi:hypothetical protein